MKCPKCEHVYVDGPFGDYCEKCGSVMRVITVVPYNDGTRVRKCFNCGHEVPAQTAPAGARARVRTRIGGGKDEG